VFKIVEKVELSPMVCRFRIEAPRLVKKAVAGQFVILRQHDKGERIPMSIGGLDKEKGILTVVIQEVGKTSASMNRMKTGDYFLDVVGPLGLPSHVEKFGRCICIGGGLGIPPIYPIALALKEAGNRVETIIGARTKDLLIYQEELTEASHKLHIATDDGSFGTHGFVTTVLEQLMKDGTPIDYIMAIGPVPMMKAVANTTRPAGIKTWVSLNPIMVDGTGMCGACRVTVGGKTRFACVDGPDFDAHEVDFEEMTSRLKMYQKQEKESYDRFLHAEGACQAQAAQAGSETDA
jgi:ferredoxin--NADP+ reductase